MRSISEAAKILNVHTQTLRNWEKKGLITPTRIGQVRIFSTYDIQRCQMIKQYSGRGVHSQGIKEILSINQRQELKLQEGGGR